MRLARYALISLAVLGVALGVVLLAQGSGSGRPAAPPAGPNILVVVTDDQRTGSMRWMPKTRRLLRGGGRTFTNAVVTTPLCCPSRASIFSGKYIHNHGVAGNGTPGQIRAYDHEQTWPEVLQEAGYTTALAGKYMNHWPREKQPPSFDFYSWADGGDARRADKRIDTLRVHDARRFVRKAEDDDGRPWALTVSLHAPHTAYDPPPRYRDLRAGPFPRNAGTRERDLSDKARVVRDLQASNPKIQASWLGHAQTLKATDDLLARLTDDLRRRGELRETLIIFISDNGYMMGEHGLTKKTWPYLGSIEVPLLVRWPGHVKAGSRSADLVANIDIAATVFDGAGVEADYATDGRSLLSGEPREWILLEGPRLHDNSPFEAWDAYLDRDAHFIQWRDEAHHRELYDLGSDPFEIESLLADPGPGNEDAAEEYAALVERARTCVGGDCP